MITRDNFKDECIQQGTEGGYHASTLVHTSNGLTAILNRSVDKGAEGMIADDDLGMCQYCPHCLISTLAMNRKRTGKPNCSPTNVSVDGTGEATIKVTINPLK